MENLLFSLNATAPLFLTMLLGFLLRNSKVMADGFPDRLNTFAFQILMFFQMFNSMYMVDIPALWDTKFVCFCVAVCLSGMGISICIALRLKNKELRPEFAQAAARSNQAYLGVALMQNLYGSTGRALTLMLLATVPFYNIISTMILTMMSPNQTFSKETLMKSLKSLAKNPLIRGIAAGMLWSVLRLPAPVAMQRLVSSVAAAASPLALITLGCMVEIKELSGCLKEALGCSFIKLFLLAFLFMPLAIWLGFRDDMLVSILIMLGCSSATSCFTMARNMGYSGMLSSSVILLTNVGSAFTLSAWIYFLRTMALI